jgi:hypothetical protein
MTEEKKITVTFAPGAFDQFDGSQEELDDLVTEITRMAESGELTEQSVPVEWEDPSDEDLEVMKLVDQLAIGKDNRKLQ